MMGLFEKFTLCCVVIVITSLSCILVASVQLIHRLEDGVNRDNGALLHKIGMLRLAKSSSEQQLQSTASPVESNDGPLLIMIIRSMKQNYALRRAIRRTWAQEDRRLEHRFVLRSESHSSRKSKTHPLIDDGGLDDWLDRLHRRGMNGSRARYFLFLNESVFVNTRFLLETIERVLPTEGFVLCTPVDRHTKGNLTCDPAHPILVSADVVHEISKNHVVHDGGRLYLSRHETEALVRQQIDDGPGLTFFFTTSLHRITQKTPLTQLIDRLWLTTVNNYTPVEY
uniref:Hexosyltransferase n=1 Tax=Anopheles farauti TaxID=69004 RepID=A0A182Q288_9DIPT